MTRPSRTALAAAMGGGVLNVAVVLGLLARGVYPMLGATTPTGIIVLTGFTLGFVATLVTAHTRLISPAVGFLSVLAATTYLELTSPQPNFGTLNGHIIVDGPLYVLSYANTWYVWLALLLLAGLVEFAIRRGYGIGSRRLQHLPTVPLSRYTIAWVVAGFAGVLGVATMLLVVRSGIRPEAMALVVFVIVFAVTAVPLAALLRHGVVIPILLFVIVVPYMLTVEVFVTTDSPVHILLFGPYAVVLGITWAVELMVRRRVLGWDGGRFVATPPT